MTYVMATLAAVNNSYFILARPELLEERVQAHERGRSERGISCTRLEAKGPLHCTEERLPAGTRQPRCELRILSFLC